MDIVVSGAGKIVPHARIKTIAAVDSARVVALHITEGQAVVTGQTLVELDATATDAIHQKALIEAAEGVLELARSQALLDAMRGSANKSDEMPRLPTIDDLEKHYNVIVDAEKWQAAQRHLHGQYRDFESRLAHIDGDIASFTRQLPLLGEQAATFNALSATNDVAPIDYLVKEQAYEALRGQLQEAQKQRASLLAEAQRQTLEAITTARRAVAAATQDAAHYAAITQRHTLSAPVDGTVQQLTLHTIGGVVAATQPLMQIVPSSGPIEIEAFINNKDKGFVHIGQSAAVKIDAFEYTKYGTLPGRVTHVSQDAIDDEKRGLIFAVKVELDKATLDIKGHETPVTTGMSVNVEIKTGRRRVIEYVLNPLLRHTGEALDER
jgi:hemolysin D